MTWINEKQVAKIVAFVAISLFCVLPGSAQEPNENKIRQEGIERSINGKEFTLVWADEFDGETTDKWENRITGYGYGNAFNLGDCAYVDGSGHLALVMCVFPKEKVLGMLKIQKQKDDLLSNEKREYIPTLAHIKTKDSFLYGYHEVRFKLPLIKGPGLDFWFAGQTPENPEIDVLEQTLYNKKGKMVDYKSSTIHWYTHPFDAKQPRESQNFLSYQFQRMENDPEEIKRIASLGKEDRSNEADLADIVNMVLGGQNIKITDPLNPYSTFDTSTNGLIRKANFVADSRHRWDDGQWHTAAMLWTQDSYSFYYDGDFVCQYKQGLRHTPASAIFSMKSGIGQDAIIASGNGEDPKTTPANVLVDYYRVYKSDETGDVLMGVNHK